MPVSITDDASQFPAITTPAGSDVPNAASVQTTVQQLANRTAFLNARALLGALAEGFESTTFPPAAPAGIWATPSPRFGTDSSWVRSTTNPIAGVASASAPVPQTLSTNSSLGLTVSLNSPSRLSVLFAVNCNANTSDHLDIIVDGVTVAQLSSQTSNVLVGGRFVSDPLREGLHTIDFRYIRGASASVAAEECKIDTVELIPESLWAGDPTRVYSFDDGFVSLSGATNIANPNTRTGQWAFFTGANAGNWSGLQAATFGVMALKSAATAAADWATAVLGSANGFNVATQLGFVEMRVQIPVLNANEIVEVGWVDFGTPGTGLQLAWAWDGSLGVGSTWRWRCGAGGAFTTLDSNIAIAAATYFRFGVTVATVRGVTSAVFTKDGKALPGAGSIPPVLTSNNTGFNATQESPAIRTRSVTGAFAGEVDIDWMRVLCLRP